MLRNDSSAIALGGGFRHVDLQLDVGRASFRRALKRLDRALEIEGRGDELLEVDLTRADEIERALVHIGVAEHGLDPQLLADRAGDVEVDRIDGNSNEHDCPRWTGKADRALNRLRRAASVENDIGAPIARLRFHGLSEVALRDVDRNDPRIAAGDV